jgi:hypothetical protein
MSALKKNTNVLFRAQCSMINVAHLETFAVCEPESNAGVTQEFDACVLKRRFDGHQTRRMDVRNAMRRFGTMNCGL